MRFVACGCFVLVALAACSDTPVSPNALRSLAAHFDSLETVESKKAVEGDLRSQTLQFIANALAHGAVPGVVTMTIAGTPVTVHMVGVEAVDSNVVAGEPVSGNVYAGGWVDRDADTSIFVSFTALTTGFIDQSVALTVGDSSEWTQAYPPQFTFSQQTLSAPCTNYPIVNQIAGPNPQCLLALATVSFNVVPSTFEGSPLLLPTGAAMVSPTVTFGLALLAGDGF